MDSNSKDKTSPKVLVRIVVTVLEPVHLSTRILDRGELYCCARGDRSVPRREVLDVHLLYPAKQPVYSET